MPCWEVNTVSLAFKPENYGLLNQAAKSLGWTMQRGGERATIRTDSGMTIVVQGGEATAVSQFNKQAIAAEVNKLRVQYAREVVNTAAQWAAAKGWRVQPAGQNKITIAKGR